MYPPDQKLSWPLSMAGTLHKFNHINLFHSTAGLQSTHQNLGWPLTNVTILTQLGFLRNSNSSNSTSLAPISMWPGLDVEKAFDPHIMAIPQYSVMSLWVWPYITFISQNHITLIFKRLNYSPIQIFGGTSQGCPHWPLMFNLSLDPLLRHLQTITLFSRDSDRNSMKTSYYTSLTYPSSCQLFSPMGTNQRLHFWKALLDQPGFLDASCLYKNNIRPFIANLESQILTWINVTLSVMGRTNLLKIVVFLKHFYLLQSLLFFS